MKKLTDQKTVKQLAIRLKSTSDWDKRDVRVWDVLAEIVEVE
jgi:hypothetical protein